MTRSMRNAVYLGVFGSSERDAVLTSTELSERTGINATQIRRDLSTLGWCGKRGVGYRAGRLAEILAPIVAIERAAIVRELRFTRGNYQAALLAVQRRPVNA